MRGLRRGTLLWALAATLAVQSVAVPAHAEPSAPGPGATVTAEPSSPPTTVPAGAPSSVPATAPTMEPDGERAEGTVPQPDAPTSPSGSEDAGRPDPAEVPADGVDPEGLPEAPTRTYIVGFDPASTRGDRAAAVEGLGSRLGRKLTTLPAVVARLTDAERARLATDPSVETVVADTPVRAADSQPNPPWGLDRIDQAGLPLSQGFTYHRTGVGVTAYVLDSGLSATDAEFGSRVEPGRSFVPNDPSTADCEGHGTHVAGIIGGATWGVAKGVTLVPVRVLDCNGTGTASRVISAIDWVVSHHKAGTPAVANLSFAGPFNKAQNDAVQTLIDDGITVAIAAGNLGTDACNFSPASSPRALTVGATDSTDHRASFSNRGRCVDLYAPGVDVPSASTTGASVETRSGTSMASPHVAGAAALVLQGHPGWSPSKVSSRLRQLTLANRVQDNPSGTPNRLLNIAPAISAVSPPASLTTGSAPIRITGTGLAGIQQVLFGDTPGTKLKVDSSTRLTVRTPSHPAGTASLEVVSELSTSNQVELAYQERPVVQSISPQRGPTRGGAVVTIHGSGFSNVLGVRFGSRSAASFTVVSPNEVQAISPPGSKGTVTVRVVKAAATSTKTAAAGFRLGKLARIRHLSATKGLTLGGERVTLTGSAFSSATAVSFGGLPGSRLTVVSSKKLRVTVPAGAAGSVDVQVVNRYGISVPTARAGWTFGVAPAPAVTKVSPASWYTTGGNQVTISGTNFHAVSAVWFGSVQAEVISVSPTRVAVRAPMHDQATVAVVVAGCYGNSATASAASYTYLDTPNPS